MISELTNHIGLVFGRDADIAYLIGRSQRHGITAVVGPPQMGKSTLLKVVAARLSAERRAGELSLQGPAPLVGWARTSPEYAITLRSAVENLYTRWLADASYLKQARIVVENEKQNWVGRVGKAFGSLVESLGKAHGAVGTTVGAAVRLTFDELAAANQELTKPGTSQLPRLQLDDSRELLRLVCEVTKRPAVLFFDQWEESADVVKESGMLRALISEIDEWPSCHIVLGSILGEHSKSLHRLARHPSGLVEVYRLKPMDTTSGVPREQLLAYVACGGAGRAVLDRSRVAGTDCGPPCGAESLDE